MIDLQTVLTYLTLISVPVGVFYHIMTLRNTRRNQELALKAQEQATETRQAQLFMQISNQTLNNPEFMDGWINLRSGEYTTLEEFIAWRGEFGSKNFNDIFRVGSALETIGVFVKEGLVDIRLIDSLMGLPVIDWWEKVGVYSSMEMKDDPHFKGYEAEYLYNELLKYRKSTR